MRSARSINVVSRPHSGRPGLAGQTSRLQSLRANVEPRQVNAAAEGTWVCPTLLDRERLVDMHTRVAFARRVQGISVGLAASAAAPFLGWWLLGLVAIAGLILLGLERAFRSSRRPEWISLASIGMLELVVTAGAAGTGGVHSPMLGWLTVPVVMLAARFPPRVVGFGLAAATGCALLAQVVADVLPDPPQVPALLAVACWGALLVSLVAAVIALQSAELQSRGDAVIDPLTGLPNRLALASRFAQAVAQAKVLDAWVSVVMCDLDHFKLVNDTYGHDVGDHVLRTAAYEMRRTLRSFEAVYRLGGEEFLVLLPGVRPAEALQLADRVRVAVCSRPAGSVGVTMSCGVASARGAAVNPDTLIREADQALYAAKHAGRNRICTFRAAAPETASVTNR